jgi:SLOG family YspA-like protein
VTGGRDFTDDLMIARVLGALRPEITLVHGGASGVDVRAALWWSKGKRDLVVYRADWLGPCREQCPPRHRRERLDGTSYCPKAGPYRNQAMVDSGLDLLLAFPGGIGTADMVMRCLAAGVTVLNVT